MLVLSPFAYDCVVSSGAVGPHPGRTHYGTIYATHCAADALQANSDAHPVRSHTYIWKEFDTDDSMLLAKFVFLLQEMDTTQRSRSQETLPASSVSVLDLRTSSRMLVGVSHIRKHGQDVLM